MRPKVFLALVAAVVVIFVWVFSSLPGAGAQQGAPAGPAGRQGTSARPFPDRDVQGRPPSGQQAAGLSGAAQQAAPGPGAGTQATGLEVNRDQLSAGSHLPLMIRWSNWREEFGPAYVYARERDLEGMLRMQGPVEKMLMVTSYGEFQRVMQRAEELQAAGVTTVGFNTEGGMTPQNEMQTLNSSDPNTNIVARVAREATAQGFAVMWGPIRNTADSISDAAVRTMMEAGVTGVALQEQKFIENQPASQRLAAVNRSRERYLGIARDVGLDNFNVDVQIMHERCPDLGNCVDFVQGLEAIPVDSIAIWSNGPIPVDFVQAIRTN